MYGKKVKLRFLFLSLILTILILTIYLVLKSLEDNVVYFISPFFLYVFPLKILSESVVDIELNRVDPAL